MRELLATTFTGIVVDENEQFYFVQKMAYIPFKKEEGTHAIGEAVEGVWLFKSKTRKPPRTTTTIPTVRIGSWSVLVLSQERDVI